MDKMREEFEQAWAETKCDDEGIIGNKPTRSKINDDCYAGSAAQFAWMWWKRSRAALCVKLPSSWYQDWDGYILNRDDDVKSCLDDAGVRYE